MLSDRVANGAAWLLLGRVLGNSLGFLGLLIVARLLTPEDFGIVAVTISVMTIVAALIELPVASALIQLEDLTDDDYNTAFTLSLLRGVVVCLLLAALAWPVAQFFDDQRLFALTAAMATYPLILGLRNSYFEVFARDLSFNQEFQMELGSKAASFLVSVAVAFYFRTYWAMPLGLLASGAMSVAISYGLCPRLPRLSLKSFSRLWNFSIWLGLGAIVNQLNAETDKLLVGRVLGPVTLGQYSVGNRLASQTSQMAMAPIMRSLYSAFSMIQQDRPRLRTAYLNAQAMMLSVIAPLGFGLGVLAEPVVEILLGEKWEPAILIVYFAAPILVINMLGGPARALGMSIGRTRTIFLRNLLAASIRIPMMAAGLLMYGLIGILVARAVSSAIMAAITLVMVRDFIGLSVARQIANCARTLGGGAAMVAVLLLVRDHVPDAATLFENLFWLGAQVGLGAVVYLSVQYGLWRIAGEPEGAETKIVGQAMRVRRLVLGR